MLKEQVFLPRKQAMGLADSVTAHRLHAPHHTPFDSAKDWANDTLRYEADTFKLYVGGCQFEQDNAFYVRRGDFMKFHFRLSGRNTTVFDGIGEYELEMPEVTFTSCPGDTVIVDLLHGGVRYMVASLLVLKEFFPNFLGIDPDALPTPLRDVITAPETPFAVHTFSMTPELFAATRVLFTRMDLGRMSDLYCEAKVTELMCLLLSSIKDKDSQPLDQLTPRVIVRLHEARDLLVKRFSEPLTLSQIARSVGLNKTTLAAGFSSTFGVTVFDFLQQERMRHAYEMLRDNQNSIAAVAEAVGYGHSCNFSTAFRRHFGRSPRDIRATQR